MADYMVALAAQNARAGTLSPTAPSLNSLTLSKRTTFKFHKPCIYFCCAWWNPAVNVQPTLTETRKTSVLVSHVTFNFVRELEGCLPRGVAGKQHHGFLLAFYRQQVKSKKHRNGKKYTRHLTRSFKEFFLRHARRVFCLASLRSVKTQDYVKTHRAFRRHFVRKLHG